MSNRIAKRLTVLLAAVLGLLAAITARAADAQWVHFNTNHMLVYSNDDLGNQICDCSYAGFGGGGVAFPGRMLFLAAATEYQAEIFPCWPALIF